MIAFHKGVIGDIDFGYLGEQLSLPQLSPPWSDFSSVERFDRIAGAIGAQMRLEAGRPWGDD